MAFQVNGKTALVTGGGSGICLSFTKLLLAEKCNVVIADLQLTPEAEELVRNTADGDCRVVFHKTDVSDWAQLRAVFDLAHRTFGNLHIVCPGAGVFEPVWSNFWNFDPKDEISSYKTLDINITHPIRATQLAIDTFIRQKLGYGAVVLVSSIAAQGAPFPVPLYSASKHAISGFVRCLGPLEQTHSIRVNAVSPGIVKTPLWTDDKLAWSGGDEVWVTTGQIAQTMLDLVQIDHNVGGTILEVGAEAVRKVEELNDPGPQGKGFVLSNAQESVGQVLGRINTTFGIESASKSSE